MSEQAFCSFLFISGATPDLEEECLGFMPAKSGIVVRESLAGGQLYFVPASGNPMHRQIAGQIGGYGFFVQGEFYEPLSAPGTQDLLTDGRLNVARLAQWVESLNGAFSGFIVDSNAGDIWGFNDRFGIGHLYMTARKEVQLLSSHLWPALCTGSGEEGWDVPAMQEILMFGYPLRDGTPLLDTRIVQPGLIEHLRGGAFEQVPYHDFSREEDPGLSDYVAGFSAVAREHFDSVRKLTGWTEYGATLSGGHDSRVVINAMMENGIKPRCYIGYDNHPTWDSARGERVAKWSGLESTVFDYQAASDQDRCDANVLADGAGTGTWTMNMARLSASRDECLYFGTSGDPVSGGWKVFPHDFADVSSLAKRMMSAYYHEYSTSQDEFLKVFPALDRNDFFAKFRESFGDGDDLIAAFLTNFYREGNFRRVRMFMQGTYLYAAPVHFFHDRRVYRYYGALPYSELIGQKVHNRLCYYARRQLGLIPASNFPIPVALEPWLLSLAKRFVSSGLRARLRPMTRKSAVTRLVLPADVRDFLSARGQALGLDVDLLDRIVAEDSRSGAIVLRANYLKNMLAPRELISKSTLFGRKRVTGSS